MICPKHEIEKKSFIFLFFLIPSLRKIVEIYPYILVVWTKYLQGECTPFGKRISAGIGESISGT